MGENGLKNYFDEFKHTVTPEDIPMLKGDLQFIISISPKGGIRSFVPPLSISFYCEKITYENENLGIHPCIFYAIVSEEDVKMEPGNMSVQFGKTVVDTMLLFFKTIISCDNNEEARAMFHSDVQLEKIKSLTDVFERKMIFEKSKYNNNQ